MAAKESTSSQNIATACIKVVENILKQKSILAFTKDPESVQRDIIEYDSRMRVFGMEKFNGPCFMSVINYYFSQEDLKNHKACGAFIFYVEESCAGKLLKALGFKGFDDEDEAAVLKICGEFCEVLAGEYKNELSNVGYKDLVLSAPTNYHNVVPEGVEFSYDEYVKYEMSFHLWKQKAVVVDITMKSLG